MAILIEEAIFTVFDFETTGLYPYGGDRICEIGAVKLRPDGSRKIYQTMVNPGVPVSYGAFVVNGITDDMIKQAPRIEKVLPGFLSFIKGSVLVAYNAGFDIGFLESALREKRDILKDYYVIDALNLARRLFKGIKRYSLSSVASALKIDFGKCHRALYDAIITSEVFKRELAILKGRGVRQIEDIGAKKRSSAKTVGDYKTATIEEAIRTEKKLKIVYHSIWDNKVTKRKVTPVEIQRGYDKDYLVAYCHLRKGKRNFRMDGIIEMECEE